MEPLDLATELTNLNDLRTKGILTDQEFDRLKQALLNRVVAEHAQSGQTGLTNPESVPEVVEPDPPSAPATRIGVVFDLGSTPTGPDPVGLAPPHSTESLPPPRVHLQPRRALADGWETAMSTIFVCYAVIALYAAYWCLVTGLRVNRYLSDFSDDLGSQILSAADTADTWSLVAAVAWIISAVAVITWSYQVRRASESLWRGDRKWSRGWAVGSFFVPFANLVIPKLALNESEKIALHPRRGGLAEPGWADRQPLAQGTLWWTGMIIAGLLSRLSANLAQKSLEEVRLLYFAQAGIFVLAAIAQMVGVSYVHALCPRLSNEGLADAQDE